MPVGNFYKVVYLQWGTQGVMLRIQAGLGNARVIMSCIHRPPKRKERFKGREPVTKQGRTIQIRRHTALCIHEFLLIIAFKAVRIYTVFVQMQLIWTHFSITVKKGFLPDCGDLVSYNSLRSTVRKGQKSFLTFRTNLTIEIKDFEIVFNIQKYLSQVMHALYKT